MEPIQRARDIFGSQAKFARVIGVSPMTITKWKSRIPAERVLPIYRATGGRISPHEMRPDLYPEPSYYPPLV